MSRLFNILKTMAQNIISLNNWLKGGVVATTTDNLRVTGAAGTDVGLRAKSGSGTGDVALEVGSSGINHGLYSFTLDKWLTYANNSYAYFGNVYSTDTKSDAYIDLRYYATSGHVDKTLYDALNSGGWASDCTKNLEGNIVLRIKETLAKIVGVFSDMFIIRGVAATVTVPANANAACALVPPTVSGYTPIGFYQITNSHGANFPITDMGVASGRVIVRNLTGTATNVTITATYLYCKTILWGG